MGKSKSALRYFVREAQKAGTVISNAILGKPTKRRSAVAKNRYVKGIKNGKYFRYKIKEPNRVVATVPKLPPLGPQTIPRPLQPPPPPTSSVASNGSIATAAAAQQQAGSAAAAAKKATSQELSTLSVSGGSSSGNHTRSSRAYEWLKQNMAVLVLNTGSICTLIGFTRSDVLELRSFSMTGSIASVVYFAMNAPIRWAPIAWSCLFASVNGYKIGKIVLERKGKVVLTEQEQDVFVEHFMPHGTTPKQFERIKQRATKLTFGQGDCIVRQGEPLKHVYLIVKGKTQASVLGRRLTAISSSPGAREERMGGDSGAWLGEMAFLEAFAEREMVGKSTTARKGESLERSAGASSASTTIATIAKQLSGRKKVNSTNATTAISTNNDDSSSANKNDSGGGGSKLSSYLFQEEKGESPSSEDDPVERENSAGGLAVVGTGVKRTLAGSLSTVMAEEDNVEVLRWSHEDIEKLMHTSTDMRAALTRAMTAPIVGKVINFTVSARTNNRPTWSTWLDDWKQSGAIVNITRNARQQQQQQNTNSDNEEEDTAKELQKENSTVVGNTSTATEDKNDSSPVVLATAIKKALQVQ
jgi:CRP-like cAMP-binding protein